MGQPGGSMHAQSLQVRISIFPHETHLKCKAANEVEDVCAEVASHRP